MHRLIKQMALGLSLGAAGLAGAQVGSVDYASLSGSVVDFESLAPSDPDGSLLEGLLSVGGLQFGERFAGQELAELRAPRPGEPAQDWFDNLAFGLPSAGLSLLAGAAGQNLGVYDYGDAGGGKALAGIGPKPGDFAENFGFGAISGRFASGQSALGFQVRDADGGQAWLSLYRADGSLIQTLGIAALDNSFYAFARSGGLADIAGFSLTHSDSYYGIAIDNFKFGSVTAVPEPGSAALLLAGLLTLGGVARRRSA